MALKHEGEMTPLITIAELEGVADTYTMLAQFAPDLAKELNDEIREVMKEVGSSASAHFPEGPARWGEAHGKDSFKVRKTRGAIGYALVNRAKSAMIIEFAGRLHKEGVNNPHGANLIASLNKQYGSTGRFAWQAWDQRRAAAYARVKARAEELAAEFTASIAKAST